MLYDWRYIFEKFSISINLSIQVRWGRRRQPYTDCMYSTLVLHNSASLAFRFFIKFCRLFAILLFRLMGTVQPNQTHLHGTLIAYTALFDLFFSVFVSTKPCVIRYDYCFCFVLFCFLVVSFDFQLPYVRLNAIVNADAIPHSTWLSDSRICLVFSFLYFSGFFSVGLFVCLFGGNSFGWIELKSIRISFLTLVWYCTYNVHSQKGEPKCWSFSAHFSTKSL